MTLVVLLPVLLTAAVMVLFLGIRRLRARVTALETRQQHLLDLLERRQSAVSQTEEVTQTPPVSVDEPIKAPPVGVQSKAEVSEPLDEREESFADAWTWEENDKVAAKRPFAGDLIDKVKQWLLGGNVVARVGAVLIFFGVGFLLKYAAEIGWLPIELRLAGVALGGMALTGVGWRLSGRRRSYALILQGGGIGVIYLTVFAAFSLYELVPAGPGLGLMVALVALSSALAVLQDARGLALLAVDGRLTGAAWPLDGAALVWVGVRQQRLTARLFGLLVQAGAGIALFAASPAAAADVAVLNSRYLSAVMIALSGLFSAYYLYRNRDGLDRIEANVATALLVWGLIWWLSAGADEISRYISAAERFHGYLVFFALSAAILAWLHQRLDWHQLVYPPLLLLPAMLVMVLELFFSRHVSHPLAGWGMPAWGLALAVQYGLLKRFKSGMVSGGLQPLRSSWNTLACSISIDVGSELGVGSGDRWSTGLGADRLGVGARRRDCRLAAVL